MERRWQVVQTRLPGGEEVPTLVDAETWLPARVAQRYVMRDRRNSAKPNTIRNELYSLARLYAWFWNEHQATTGNKVDLDDFLVSGNTLGARQLDSLVDFLRINPARKQRQGSPHLEDAEEQQLLAAATFDRNARAIHRFLHFAMDAAHRGGQPSGDWEKIAMRREQLRAYFQHTLSSLRVSIRIEPLAPAEEDAVITALGPVYSTAAGGHRRLALPVRFAHPHFTPQTQLRNWLMFRLALDCGLRLGEILKLTLADIVQGRNSGLKLVRRPDDAGDSRTILPAVKTSGRDLPTTPEIDFLLTAYISGPQPGRRAGGKTHYLITAESGEPLAISTAAKLIDTFRRHSGVPHLRWHTLRHTWAEAFISACLSDGSEPISRNQKESAFDRLKYAGGWRSDEAPRHYIQQWIQRHTQAFMRQRIEQMYGPEPMATETAGPDLVPAEGE